MMMQDISDGRDLPAYYLFNGTKMLMFDYYNKANKFTTGYTSYYETHQVTMAGGPAAPIGYGSPEYRPD